MVVRPTIKTLNDLKGKKIVLQENGPHVDMLSNALHSAGLKWSDITVVWTNDITPTAYGPTRGPAIRFRNDKSIDACFVISPDMVELTGGYSRVGTGTNKSVRGARVLLSTVTMDRSIADVYACRKDYFDENRSQIDQLTAAYFKASEEVIDLRKNETLPAKDRNEKLRRYAKTGLRDDGQGPEPDR